MKNSNLKNLRFLVLFLLATFILSFSGKAQTGTFTIEYEKYTLDNGLEVILHQDDSDPIVAVAILYHVGSSREKPGKTGFAHLFEHILFNRSENIPQGGFDIIIQNAGGTLNGGTSYDYTVYYEVVPKNALERVLWMESDRMGFIENAFTSPAFITQQNVVLNEKRQRVDNQPYGHTNYVIHNTIFPEGHPYNWTVIGEMEDLKNATLEDVKDFYNNYYGPNNATLVIAGDFSNEEVRYLVDKYFAEIPAGRTPEIRESINVTLDATIKLVHEDNFATQPQLQMVWPTIQSYTDDDYALRFLGQILAGNKKAPMYRHLVRDTRMTSNTSAAQNSLELAGTFNIVLTANEGFSLKDLENGVFESFRMFEEQGISETDLERIKAGLEMSFYSGLSTVYDKSVSLALYNALTGDPGYIEENIKKIQAITVDDVMRVYETYIKDKPYVATSFVPKGKSVLAAENSIKAEVVEEDILQAAAVTQVTDTGQEEITKTPSRIDRSIEPPLGADPVITIPEIWTASLSNGMEIYGIEQQELPIVYFDLVIEGGFKADALDKLGVANMMTDLMMEGTITKTPEELEEEIELLGAHIGMYTSNEEIVISGASLSRNFKKTMDIIQEILLEPRWDEEQFELKKNQNINYLIQYEGNPSFIASREFNKLAFGEDHVFGHYSLGTIESVSHITIEDLKNFYHSYFSPTLTTLNIAGDISQEQVIDALQGLEVNWKARDVHLPQYEDPVPVAESKIYFYDMPGSKQSVIYIGNLSIGRDDPDYYAAYVMNYNLGGTFISVLNMILREEKGYTYGASSGFSGRKGIGTFVAGSSVQSDATFESVRIFKEEMEKYKQGISEEDLWLTKNALIRSNVRRFETLESIVSMLEIISKYDLPFDYVKDQENTVRNMTIKEHRDLASKYLQTDKMIYLIVGDAETQFGQLSELGLGEPVLLNK
ncbi:MAG: insulinase family protein [Bacteroidales bacterium]|nr:insulinase family protein [Bacteroidales bacterium]